MTAKTAAKGEAKFTPGEWLVTGVPVSEHEYRLYDADGNIHKTTHAERQANAKLMQVSPEMYQALQDILGCGSIQEADRIAFAVLDKLKEETHG